MNDQNENDRINDLEKTLIGYGQAITILINDNNVFKKRLFKIESEFAKDKYVSRGRYERSRLEPHRSIKLLCDLYMVGHDLLDKFLLESWDKGDLEKIINYRKYKNEWSYEDNPKN